MMNDARTDMDPQELVNIPPDLGKQFTEIFVKDPENVQLVLSFLSVISFFFPLELSNSHPNEI